MFKSLFVQEFDYLFQPVSLDGTKKFMAESLPSLYYPLQQVPLEPGPHDTKTHTHLFQSHLSLERSPTPESDDGSINLIRAESHSPPYLENGCKTQNSLYVPKNGGSLLSASSKSCDDLMLPANSNHAVNNKGYLKIDVVKELSSSSPYVCMGESSHSTAPNSGYVATQTCTTSSPRDISVPPVISVAPMPDCPVEFEFNSSTDQELNGELDLNEAATNDCVISFEFGGSHEDREAVSFTPEFPRCESQNHASNYITLSQDNLKTSSVVATKMENGYVVPIHEQNTGNRRAYSCHEEDVNLSDLSETLAGDYRKNSLMLPTNDIYTMQTTQDYSTSSSSSGYLTNLQTAQGSSTSSSSSGYLSNLQTTQDSSTSSSSSGYLTNLQTAQDSSTSSNGSGYITNLCNIPN